MCISDRDHRPRHATEKQSDFKMLWRKEVSVDHYHARVILKCHITDDSSARRASKRQKQEDKFIRNQSRKYKRIECSRYFVFLCGGKCLFLSGFIKTNWIHV